jgi:3-dehydroquinate synthase
MRTVTVEIPGRSYPIHIGPGARQQLRALVARRDPAQVVVIADRNVADLHLDALAAALPAVPPVVTFPAGENSKSLACAERVFGFLAEQRVERGAIVIAFGGGVAGDLGGFVAATWLRGIAFVPVATSLLAAVDASVGGKTAVNIPAGKNLVGAFHQPVGVIVDLDFLETLSGRDYASGLAECVKQAAIRDPDLFAWLEAHGEAILKREPDVLGELIARNCEVKAAVVSADEREMGLRAILNYGHTLGHAIEHRLEYDLRHGECVALGMIAENEIARGRGMLAGETVERIRALLRRCGLPTVLPRALDPAEVIESCRVDKKVQGGVPHFVLLRDVGDPVRGVADVSEAEIAAAMSAIAPG